MWPDRVWRCGAEQHPSAPEESISSHLAVMAVVVDILQITPKKWMSQPLELFQDDPKRTFCFALKGEVSLVVVVLANKEVWVGS